MPHFKFFMNSAWIIPVLLVLHAHQSNSALVSSNQTTPPPPGHRARPPRIEPKDEQEGIESMLQGIRSSLLRLESSLFAPPCNATGPGAPDCDAPPAPGHRTDWLGRHHFGLRRQILSYAPPPTPTPPGDWYGGTPGPDGFYDSAPEPDLPSLSP